MSQVTPSKGIAMRNSWGDTAGVAEKGHGGDCFYFERLADSLGRLAVSIETVSLALKTVARDRPRDWKCYRARDLN